MRMRNKHILTIIVAFISVMMLFGCYRTPEQRAERLVNRISDKLELSAIQKTKLTAIKDEFMAKGLAMRKAREETFDQMVSLMKSDKSDQNELNAIINKNKAQADGLIEFAFSKYVEFHDMLTPTQRAKAAKEMEEWKEHHRRKHY